jgi:hypothetical protein
MRLAESQTPAVRNNRVVEIKSPLILQPGPAAPDLTLYIAASDSFGYGARIKCAPHRSADSGGRRNDLSGDRSSP